MKTLIQYLKYAFLCVVAAVFASACGSRGPENVSQGLDDAERDVEGGLYARAAEICDALTQSADTVHFTWRDYCRAANIYAVAYDHDIDTEASMASATRCIERARALNADSVEIYLASLSPVDAAPLNTVIQTLDALNTDLSNLGDHEEEDAVHEHDEGAHIIETHE